MSQNSGPGEPGPWRTLIWIVAVVISATVCSLVAFYITSELLDDGAVAGASADRAPAGESATGGNAAALEDADSRGATQISPGALAGGPIPGDEEPPEELFTTTKLPDFDPDTLIYGGAGADGAILAGPGIVRSSGADRRTNWEMIVPSAQIHASIVRVGVTPSNLLGAPDNPEVIGWWEDGPAPGEPGNVLMDGHRDYRDIFGNVGFGVCWLLTETRPGDLIIVRDLRDARAYVYTVTEVHSVAWDDPSGDRFLRSTEASILTLVTCEGAFDEETHNYSQRRVVIAELTDRVAPPSVGG
ncbi:MAG: class F sortase [Chloroflexi bacterium]|nr:class F sortase [Chloroflexota bacterium]